jgi:hypothetical protein
MNPTIDAALSKLRVENLVIQRQVELLSARLDLLVMSVNQSPPIVPIIVVEPVVEPARTFHCPFRPCEWSVLKCSAASGIHHMHTCINRPVGYHYEVGHVCCASFSVVHNNCEQIVKRIACFQKHPRLNDATMCCWCGRKMLDYSRDQRSRHRNDCLKVVLCICVYFLFGFATYM